MQNILMFYYKSGSKDYPLNADPNAAFGYDVNSVGEVVKGPIFKYSMNEVEKAFVKVRHLQKEAIYESGNNGFVNIGDDKTNLVNNALVETGSSTKYSVDYSTQDLETADVKQQIWTDIFSILEWLYANQASANGNRWSSAPDSCINTADCAFMSDVAAGSSVHGSNPYKITNYVEHSIQIFPSTKEGRISYVKFSVKNNDNSGEAVTVTAYFDADAWVERSTNISYAVYRYEDLNNDSTIDDSEFDTQIVNKIFEISKTGKYKTYSSTSVRKRISNDNYVQEQFFVFSSLANQLTSATMIEQIKQYLLGLGYGESLLNYTYPDLFGQNTILIVPVWDNQINTKDSGLIDVYPLSLRKLNSVLVSLGKSISEADAAYSPTEIFYIGPGAGWTPSVNVNFILPILAIEQSTQSGVINPISARFPNYQPLYGQNLKSDAAEFHFVLMTILSYLNDSENVLAESFKNSYSITETVSADAYHRKLVSFVFGSNTWTVYGKLNSDVAG